MKYCTHCGKELLDEAVICVGCGCACAPINPAPVNNGAGYVPQQHAGRLVQTLSQRVKIDGIIWMVIGGLQIIGGLLWSWPLLIVGVLNIIAAVQDLQYSKKVLEDQNGIVAKFQPLTGPIITLVYNLVIGGIIGVGGSIYYLVAVRNFVMENRDAFAAMETPAPQQPTV